MGAAEGAVDVDESGLRQHQSLAQGDAASAPGSTEAGTEGGGLATTSDDCEQLEERPESVLLDSCSRPGSVLLDSTLLSDL